MFDFGILSGTKLPSASMEFINQIDFNIKRNESFLRTVQKWRNLEISYIGKLAQLHSEAVDRASTRSNKADNEMAKSFQTLLNNHKNLINKLNHDIFLVNYEQSQKIITENKQLLENEKGLHKQLLAKKQIIEKVFNKKLKLKKNMEEEQTLQIFSHDSVDTTMDKKLKRFNKLKSITKEQEQYELKVKETKQMVDIVIDKSRVNLDRFNQLSCEILRQKNDIVAKMKLHISTFAKSLSIEMEELINNEEKVVSEDLIQFCNNFITEEEKRIVNFTEVSRGYLETTLQLINDKSIDEMIEYSKDKEVKKKIKKIIQSNNVNPEDTDELTRQVQLVKKILKNKDSSSMAQFKTIINKNCRFRMNFVFILQLYRLNSKFQIPEAQLKPMIVLINQLLNCSHQQRDAFVLSQIMVLLLTYYVFHRENDEEQKLYILNFFKQKHFWKDNELWESILIECIYIEKKATVKMFMITSATSNKSEIYEAEKQSILNQILYIVRNMILFDFTEKEVKEFVNKFVKMLKQDDKFLRDVYKSIDDAIKEENSNKPKLNTPKFIDECMKNEQTSETGAECGKFIEEAHGDCLKIQEPAVIEQ